MGLVVDVGYDSTTIYRYGLRWGTEPVGPWRINTAGQSLTQYLKTELQQYDFADKIDDEIAEFIKEELCYVSKNFE